MPPNARDSDNISQDREASDTGQENQAINGVSNSENNGNIDNHVQSQNGDGLPHDTSTSRVENQTVDVPVNGNINFQSNLINGAEASSRLEEPNTTIYIIPGCDTSLNPLSSSIRDHQAELNGNSVSIQPHLYVLPSAPNPPNFSIAQPYSSYNQSAPPDYYTNSNSIITNNATQPRVYTVAPAPYGDPPPEYDSWSRDTSTARNSTHGGTHAHPPSQQRYQQYNFSHPFQPISIIGDECRDHTLSARPPSVTSTSTVCCANDSSRSGRIDNLNPVYSLHGRGRDGCDLCNNRLNPHQRQRNHQNNDSVFNISGNTTCGPTCHYQFPIQAECNNSGTTNTEGDEGEEEEYDRMTNSPSAPPEYLTVKRWVMVVLLLLLLTTFSLLLGVSMQHYQLLKKFVFLNKSISDRGDNKLYRYHPKFVGNINHIFSVPSRARTTPLYVDSPTNKEDGNTTKTVYNEKRKRDIPKYISNVKTCNNIIDLPTRENLKFILSKVWSTDTSNSILVMALCSNKLDLELLDLKPQTGRNNFTSKVIEKDEIIYERVCTELLPIAQTNQKIFSNLETLFHDIESQDCILFMEDDESYALSQNSEVMESNSINCHNHSNNGKEMIQKKKMVDREKFFYRLLSWIIKCTSTEPLQNEEAVTSRGITSKSSSSKFLPRK